MVVDRHAGLRPRFPLILNRGHLSVFKSLTITLILGLVPTKIGMRSGEENPARKSVEPGELKDILAESPFLIPLEEVRGGVYPLAYAVKGFRFPHSDDKELLAFSSDGDIAIVDCGLSSGIESKRSAIGKLLEHSAYLWGMSYEELNNEVFNLENLNLSELVKEAVGGECYEENIRRGVEQSLQVGSFILVLAVDKIDEELKSTIRYLNECIRSRGQECVEPTFSLHAMEVDVHPQGELVPQLYGTSKRPSGGAEWRKQSEKIFFKQLEDEVRPIIANVIKALYEGLKEKADRIWFKAEGEKDHFTFNYLKKGRIVSVFTITSDGFLTLNYNKLSQQAGEETVQEFHKMLKDIPSFKQLPDEINGWPTIKVSSAFKTSSDVEQFKKAVSWLEDKIYH